MTRALHAADRLLERLYLICGVIAAAFLVALGGCVLLSIVTRLFGIYVGGLTEYSGYAMAASSFFALAHTFREGSHIRVGLLRSRLRGSAKLAIELWCLALATLLSSFLAWYFVRLTWFSFIFEERSEGAAATLLWIPQSLAAFGASVMAIATLHALVRTAASRNPDAFVKANLDSASGDA